jgi:hypothetical protein
LSLDLTYKTLKERVPGWFANCPRYYSLPL